MGNSSPNCIYSIPLQGTKKAHFSHIYRNPDHLDKLIETPNSQILTLKDMYKIKTKQFCEKSLYGTIITKKNKKNQDERSIDFITYQDHYTRAENIGSGIYRLGLFSEAQDTTLTRGKKMKFIGIYSKNRLQWVVTDAASILYGLTTVPLYDTLGVENLSYCLNHTQMTTCFCSGQCAEVLLKLKDFGKLKNLVLFDMPKQQSIIKLKQKFQIIFFEELYNIGKNNKVPHQKIQISPYDCHTFSYTSGTTGPPKGAMISHRNLVALLSAFKNHQDLSWTQKDRHLSFLPLPHIYERAMIYACYLSGSCSTFYSGDILKIKDDAHIVKPTIFAAVPRLYNRIYDTVHKKFEEEQGVKKYLIDSALTTKTTKVQQTGICQHLLYDAIVFSKTKQALGGSVKLLITASAPLKPQIQKFIKIIMCAPMIQVYGQTQNTGAAFATFADDNHIGHVGGIVPALQFKLADITEMNYTSNDINDKKQSTPRGQIWLRGPMVFMGYYKDLQKTKQALTQDGWLKTGDVGMLLPYSNALKIIDRKKNIFKLQQGQYIASQKVQEAYTSSKYVSQVFLTGQSTQIFAVAIINPHSERVKQLGNKLGKNINNIQQLYRDKDIRTQICKDLDQCGKKKGLHSFQQAKNIYLDTQTFLAREILTNTMKLQRFQAKKYYANEIKNMYEEGMLPIK